MISDNFIFEWLHFIFTKTPEIALFLALGLGYAIGKVSFVKFQLGGVAGSLLAGVLISQVGVSIDPGVKAVLFALFIYAVGFESGPQFFRSLGRKNIREILLALTMAVCGLATVVIVAKIFGFDKGFASGIAAGAMTESAVMATAGDAIKALNATAAEINTLQTNVGIGYAVTYIFGTFGTIIVAVNILPKFMGRGIREDAIVAEAELQMNKAMGVQQDAAFHLTGRFYKIDKANGKTIQEIENYDVESPITIQNVKRGRSILTITPELKLQTNDIIFIIGNRSIIAKFSQDIGTEIQNAADIEISMKRINAVMTNTKLIGQTFAQIKEKTKESARHGVYFLGITRGDKTLPVLDDTVLALGDICTLYGAERDVMRTAKGIGHILAQNEKTDMIYLSFGLVIGLLIGMLDPKVGIIPLSLGSGGGALVAGLFFGWYRSRKLAFGSMPPGAINIMKDLGLAGFVAIIGLNSGAQAITTIQQHGISIFVAGILVTTVPLILTMFVGKYILRYKNTAVFAGALSGARSANPAFGQILEVAQNSVPTLPFAVTYALANVFLTLMGPIIVALV